jgi:hypothetical protein
MLAYRLKLDHRMLNVDHTDYIICSKCSVNDPLSQHWWPRLLQACNMQVKSLAEHMQFLASASLPEETPKSAILNLLGGPDSTCVAVFSHIVTALRANEVSTTL